jgi:hypothetical protein
MSKVIDLVGRRFGSWLVLHNTGERRSGHLLWRCLCDCGTERDVSGSNLRNGVTKSCGCKESKRVSKVFGIHRVSKHPLYHIYMGMYYRCYEEHDTSYESYGGRGIYICDEWRENPDKFFEWSLNNGWAPGLSIDRIDNDGCYGPDNCRWTTMKEQNKNRRNTIYVSCEGVKRPLCEVTEELGLDYNVVHKRFRNLGWSLDRALTEPVKKLRLHVGV